MMCLNLNEFNRKGRKGLRKVRKDFLVNNIIEDVFKFE
jgi:hypothetical protein